MTSSTCCKSQHSEIVELSRCYEGGMSTDGYYRHSAVFSVLLLYCTVLYCAVPNCTVQYRTVLYSTELYCNELNGITEYYVLYDEMNITVSAFHSLHFNVHT